MIKWIMVFFILIGDFLIIEKIREGFYLWVVVDGFFAVYNFYDKDYVQGTVFGLYAIMGLYGLYSWM